MIRREHIKKIAVGLILLAVALLGVFLVNNQNQGGRDDKPSFSLASEESKDSSEKEEKTEESKEVSSKEVSETSTVVSEDGDSQESTSLEQVEITIAEEKPVASEEPVVSESSTQQSSEMVSSEDEPAEVASEETPVATLPASSEPTQETTSSETSQDQYSTDPVPEDKPQPVEPEEVEEGDEVAGYVSLQVRVDTLVANPEVLEENLRGLVPESGVIFSGIDIPYYEGESAFDVLERTMRESGIHMSFRSTPMYNSAYIEAINNLYELAGGPLSGWMYSVNGWFPNYGMSRYQLSPGDAINMVYTLDLGRDVGGEGASIGGGD